MSFSVYIYSCCPKGAQRNELLRLGELFPDKRMVISSDMDSCDLILVTDITSYRALGSIVDQKRLSGFFGKVVVFGEMDYPPKQFPCIGPSVGGVLPNAALPYYFLMKAMDDRFGWQDRDAECNRSLLFSFQGRICNQLRADILDVFSKPDDAEWLVVDTGELFPVFKWRSVSDEQLLLQRKKYLTVLRQSRFVLCPAGVGASSIRMYEALRCGAVPVVISDDWQSPCGVDLDGAIVRVSESMIKDLPSILAAEEKNIDTLMSCGKELLPQLIGEQGFWSRLVDGMIFLHGAVDVQREVNVLKLKFYVWVDDARRFMRQRKRDIFHVVKKYHKS